MSLHRASKQKSGSPTRRMKIASAVVAATLVVSGGALISAGMANASSAPPSLGSASTYAVLAGAATTIPGATITGDVGADAAETISGSTIIGVTHPSGTSGQAIADAKTAYASLKEMIPTGTLTGDDLGGQTITPGVYHRAAALAETTAVTFDAQNNENAIFVIQSEAALNTTASIAMVLLNGAKASNIFWVPTGAATLGASSTFDGIIISGAAVTIGASSTLNGQALSTIAAVTLGASVTINGPTGSSTQQTSGSTTSNSSIALPQSADGAAAYAYLKALAPTGTLTGDDLGTQTIKPGVYHRAAALAETTPVTFDAQNVPGAIFVIQSDAALNTTASIKMNLINGAQAKNIYWVPTGAATLGASSIFYGNILSGAAVTVGASAIVHGNQPYAVGAITLGASATIGLP